MTSNEQLLDQLDRYIKGTLSPEESLLLDEKIRQDENFRLKVEEHRRLITALKQYDDRESIKKSLNIFQQELDENDRFDNASQSFIKKYFPTFAVAASVALISIVGTLIAIGSLEKKQTAEYKELRRNVEQIKKSQKNILADIREAREKDKTPEDNYEGTGFLIASNGYIATSYHVIRDADSVYIENKKFGRFKATVVRSDVKNDVALLKITNPSFKAKIPFVITLKEASIGEDVFTLGFPREDIVFGEGSISSSTGYKGAAETYQITVPVNPGNSGGPLISRQGELVGMISGVQTETSGAAFAVKSSIVLDVIKHAQEDSTALLLQLSRQNQLKNLSKVDQVKKLMDVVFVVKVYNNK